MTQQPPVDRSWAPSCPPDECELISALREGDLEAWGEVYRTYRRAARVAAARVVLDSSVAEDLTQEAFLILPQALRGFRGECRLRAFILSITHNLARHHLRALYRRRRAMVEHAAIPEITVVASPEHLLARRQMGFAIARALATLSPERQTAFLLHEHMGHSAPEAARLTHALETTVRTRVYYARQQLREALANDGYARSA